MLFRAPTSYQSALSELGVKNVFRAFGSRRRGSDGYLPLKVIRACIEFLGSLLFY